MKTIIAIPVYKKEPSADEILSLKQCFKILSRYDICLVCPETLNTAPYEKHVNGILQVKRFNPAFFEGIEGYNNLMTSMSFYKSFTSYDYMLIYQLDAWVFADNLEEWCAKDYDYIGAPWFERHLTHEDGCDLWCCGNGGFSLRKINKFIEVTNPNTRLFPFKEILKKYFKKIKTWDRGFSVLLNKNNMKWYRKKMSRLWEDAYFCYGLDETPHKLKRPSAEEAASFAFECSPKYLYHMLGDKLPFGCHAWKRYQYEEFWSKFIPEKN